MDLVEFTKRNSNGIGPMRRSRRVDSHLLAAQRGRYNFGLEASLLHGRLSVEMKDKQDPNVGKAFQATDGFRCGGVTQFMQENASSGTRGEEALPWSADAETIYGSNCADWVDW